jgi:predicted nucleic acid-binding protein
MTLVDTNVFLDLIKRDPVWMPWSVAQLQKGRDQGGLATNMVVYAELTGYPQHVVDVDQMLDDLQVRSMDLSRPAARLAGQAFRAYRERGGAKTGVLPDFFIGAHALAEGHTLLTRDGARYRSYFPGIALICP